MGSSCPLSPPRIGQKRDEMLSPMAMNRFGIALMLLLVGASAPSIDPDAIMDRIEAVVTLPPGASPLPTYDRFYALEERDDGVRKVLGTFMRGQPQQQRHWVEQSELPLVMDGGCDIVTLTYDVDADRIERVECNGEG